MSEPASSGGPLVEGAILAGKYRVEQILGRGGMGVVVAATHLQLRQKVAIKFLLPGATPDVIERFLREARAAARLKSEHVARVIDVSALEDGSPYMVMEHLHGKDLSRVIKNAGQLPILDSVDWLLQACEAIAEAHVAGIVHRDLKPANLFLTTSPDGSPTIKVLDFGISKSAGDEDLALTGTAAILGSPYYMAPEQMRQTRSADHRADIWALGVILYQMITGTVPRKEGHFLELVLKVNNEDAPPPTLHRGDLPPGLVDVIMRCLKRNPDERFATVTELAIAVAPFGGPEAAAAANRCARTQGATATAVERPTHSVPAPSVRSFNSGSHPSEGPSIPSMPRATSTPNDTVPDDRVPVHEASSPRQPPAAISVSLSKTPGSVAVSNEESRPQIPLQKSRLPWAIAIGGALGIAGVLAAVRLHAVDEPMTPKPAASSAPTIRESAAPSAPMIAPPPSAETPPPLPASAAPPASALVPQKTPPKASAHPSPTAQPSVTPKKNPLDLEIQ